MTWPWHLPRGHRSIAFIIGAGVVLLAALTVAGLVFWVANGWWPRLVAVLALALLTLLAARDYHEKVNEELELIEDEELWEMT